MKNIFKIIGTTIVVILVILLILWLYPLTMEKDSDGTYHCENIFGHYVQCND